MGGDSRLEFEIIMLDARLGSELDDGISDDVVACWIGVAKSFQRHGDQGEPSVQCTVYIRLCLNASPVRPEWPVLFTQTMGLKWIPNRTPIELQ